MGRKGLSEGGGESSYVGVRFPREQAARVVELANEAGTTQSAYIRQAVADAIERGADEDGEQ